MRRLASALAIVVAVVTAQVVGLAPARATVPTALPAGEAMYLLDWSGTTWAGTDLANGHFVSTGNTPDDSANDYGPTEMSYNAVDHTVYALEWSVFGRRIERVDPSTGRRWGSVQINEPEGNDWIVSLAISPGGQFYGLGDQGGLYSISLGATNATVTKLGMTGIGGPQYGLAFDGSFLFAFDVTTKSIKWLSLADGSTLQTFTLAGLPSGLGTGTYPKQVVSMQVDSAQNFWLSIQDPNGSLTTSYVGAYPTSGSTISLSSAANYWNVAGSNPTPGLSAPVYANAMVIAPPIDSTAIAHTQSAGTVTYGGSVTLSMTATDTTTHTALAGVGAQLQRWTGSAWAGVKNVTTSSTGSASFAFVPTISATYRWYAAGRTAAHDYYVATSPAFAVKVAVRAATPTISGTVRHGSTLTAHPGTWAPTGISFTYQWYLNGVAIKGATKPTLALGSGAIGRRVSVHVTGSRTGYVSVTRGSASTAPVA